MPRLLLRFPLPGPVRRAGQWPEAREPPLPQQGAHEEDTLHVAQPPGKIQPKSACIYPFYFFIVFFSL